jgi:hypothetical protein
VAVVRAFAAACNDWYGVTEDDRARAIPLLFPTFKLFENAWFQHRQGTLDSEQWEGWDAYIRMYYHHPWGENVVGAAESGFRAGFS